MVYGAASNRMSIDESTPAAPKIGQYLNCDQQQLEAALQTQRELRDQGEDKRLGQILVELGLISEDRLWTGVLSQRVDRLRSCPLFARLNDEEMGKVCAVAEEVELEPGQQFISQDTPATFMDVIISGSVLVYRNEDDGTETPIAAIWPCEAIGDLGYFSDGVRTASVRAIGETQTLRIHYVDLAHLIQELPSLASGFLDVVTKRLRDTNVRYQENLARRRTAERSLRHLNEYLDISANSALRQGIEGLIDRLVKTASKVMKADRASLFLIDPVTNELWSKVAQGAETKEIRVPAGAGIVGPAAKTGEMINIPDAYADERFNQAVDKKTGYRTRNILCGPVRNLQGEIIGAIQVINKDRGPFGPEDENIFRAFANQAAIAVENFNLYQRLMTSHYKMSIMLDVANAITQTLDIGELINTIVEKVEEILRCDRASFFVYDESSNELWSMVARGTKLAEIRFPADTGLAGHCATNMEVVNIRDAYEDERFNQAFDKKTGYRTRSVLCVPVWDRDGSLAGVVQAINKATGFFDEEDEDLLGAIGSQIGLSLQNAKLYADTVRMKNYLQSVQESISAGIVTLDEDYRIVTGNTAAFKLFDSETGAIVGQDIRQVLGGDNATITEAITSIFKDDEHKEVIEYDLEFISPTGREGSINLTAQELLDHEGVRDGVVIVIEDITEEKRTRSTLTRYMPREIVEQVMNDPRLRGLGGISAKATVLMSDIRQFTTICEGLSAEAVLDFLNEYFTLMVDETLAVGGIADKYMGDALMALYGVPIPSEDDAVNAVQSALRMKHVLDEFNAEREAAELPAVHIGIGVNTGELIHGNLGSVKKMDYTVIGDAVNVCARLEGLNKQYGTTLLISETTRGEIGDHFTVRLIDYVVVKGKTRPVCVFEVLGGPDYQLNDEQRCFVEGFDAYQSRQFDRALELFQSGARTDAPCRVFAERCEHFLLNPPADDWDGVFHATTK